MKTILLIGKNGQVGWELQHALLPIGRVFALDRSQLDLTQPDTIRRTIRDITPDIIVNAAGYTAVDKAEQEPKLAMQVNAVAPGIIAEETKRIDALLVHYSTDYVYDGTSAAPYVEEDVPNPVNAYGHSKLAGERAIAATNCAHLILRTSWIYSARGANFVFTMLKLARERKELFVVDDQIGSPTSALDLAKCTSELLRKAPRIRMHTGVFHLSANGYVSRFAFAEEIIQKAKSISGNPSGWASIRAIKSKSYLLPASRPLNASTSKKKIMQIFGIEMTTWADQLHENLENIISKTQKGVSP